MKFIKGARTWRSILGTQTFFWPLTPGIVSTSHYAKACAGPSTCPSHTRRDCGEDKHQEEREAAPGAGGQLGARAAEEEEEGQVRDERGLEEGGRDVVDLDGPRVSELHRFRWGRLGHEPDGGSGCGPEPRECVVLARAGRPLGGWDGGPLHDWGRGVCAGGGQGPLEDGPHVGTGGGQSRDGVAHCGAGDGDDEEAQ